MITTIEEYKENMCKFCVHNGDDNFEKCHICESIKGKMQCTEFIRDESTKKTTYIDEYTCKERKLDK